MISKLIVFLPSDDRRTRVKTRSQAVSRIISMRYSLFLSLELRYREDRSENLVLELWRRA